MDILLFWLFGWVLFFVGYIIYNKYIVGHNEPITKLMVYEGIKYGMWSWIGIAIMVVFFIIMLITAVDEWLTEKFSKNK